MHKLALQHVVFFRSIFESDLELMNIATRYLGDEVSLPEAKRVMLKVQEALVQTSKRRGKHGAAALLRIPRGRLSSTLPEPFDTSELSSRPTLEEFRDEVDPGGFYSEAELVGLYEDEHGEPSAPVSPSVERKLVRNGRLLEKKIRLINDLIHIIAQPPTLDDQLEGWLDTKVAKRLATVGLFTLKDLIGFMNHRGYRWFTLIPAMGEKKAADLVRFIKNNGLGEHLDGSALTPARTYRAERTTSNLPVLRGAIVPLEKFSSPSELDGSLGSNRMPAERNRLDVANDLQAIQAWLGLYASKPNTERAYRKEAERLLLWAIYVKHKPFSSLNTVDVTDYLAFLRDPQPASVWVSDRRFDRFHSAWRPFVKGGLNDRSVAYAVLVLKSMCTWLVGQRYLDSNPFDGLPRMNKGTLRPTHRSLSFQQWGMVRQYINELPVNQSSVRLKFLMTMLYATGLRRSEIANAKFNDLRVRHFGERSTWFINVIGKGEREREVPFVRPVMTALHEYMNAKGLHFHSVTDVPAGTPMISSLDDPNHRLSDNAIYIILKNAFNNVADWAFDDDKEAAATFRKASTHWLRHTHATHALRRGVKLESVRDNLGHSSIAISSLYIDTDLEEQHRATEAFIEGSV